MKIEKSELAQKLNKIKGIVPKKSHIPALYGVLVDNGYLIASNTEITIKTKLEGVEGENFIIPEKAFDLINNLPDGEMDITVIGKDAINIKTGKIRNRYQTVDPGEFPVMVWQENGSEFDIDAEVFLRAVKHIFYAMSSREDNTVMTSMCLQAGDGQLNFVGSDGRVLAWDRVDYDGEFELLIPRNTVEILKSVGFSGRVKIKHSKIGAVFITEEIEVYTRLVEGKYFGYQKVFNKLPIHTIVPRLDLLSAMTRVKMCTKERSPVKFEIEGNSLNLSIKDQTTDYSETVELQQEMTEALMIGFDVKLVLETLKSFDCENVRLSFGGPKMPMIVEADGIDFKTVVLPVVIK